MLRRLLKMMNKLIQYISPKCFQFHSEYEYELPDLRNGAADDNFGASFIFERALKRMDVQTEQRRLQKEKYEGQLKDAENDYKQLELRLKQQHRDFVKVHDKFKSAQDQLVAIKIQKDILEMKLIAEAKNVQRLTRDNENLQWSKNELLDMIRRSRNIEQLRQKLLARRLY